MSFDCDNFAIQRFRAIRYRPLRFEGASSCHNTPGEVVDGLGYEIAIATPVRVPGGKFRADYLANYGSGGSVARARPVKVLAHRFKITLTVGGTVEVGDLFKVTLVHSHWPAPQEVEVAATTTSLNQTATDIADALSISTLGLFEGFSWRSIDNVVVGKMSTEFDPPTVYAATTEAGGGAADGQTFTLETETQDTTVFRLDGPVLCPTCLACWVCDEEGNVTLEREDIPVANELTLDFNMGDCGDDTLFGSLSLARCSPLTLGAFSVDPCVPIGCEAEAGFTGVEIARWETAAPLVLSPDWSKSHGACEWTDPNITITAMASIRCEENTTTNQCKLFLEVYLLMQRAQADLDLPDCPVWWDCCGSSWPGGISTTGYKGCVELDKSLYACGHFPPASLSLQTTFGATGGETCSGLCGIGAEIYPVEEPAARAARTLMSTAPTTDRGPAPSRPVRRKWIGAKARQFALAVTGPATTPEVQSARLAQCGSNECGYLLKIDPKTRNAIGKAARAVAEAAGVPSPEGEEWYCKACGCSTYNPLAELHNKTKYAALECPCEPPYWVKEGQP